MARKKKGASPKVIKTTAKQLQDAIRDAASAAQRAKNAGSNKSTTLSDYCARSGLPAKSVKLVLDCHNMEDLKRQDFVRGFLMCCQLMGWGDQGDLRDDVGAMITAAAKAAEDDEKARKGQAAGSPGLPLEALEKGIKPLDGEAPKARRTRNALPAAPAPTPEAVS